MVYILIGQAAPGRDLVLYHAYSVFVFVPFLFACLLVCLFSYACHRIQNSQTPGYGKQKKNYLTMVLYEKFRLNFYGCFQAESRRAHGERTTYI